RAVTVDERDRRDVFSAADPKTDRRARPRSFVRLAQSAMSRGSPGVTGQPAEDGSWRVSLRRGRGAARFRRGSFRNLRIDIGRAAGRRVR
ncbi:MAG TPA: hypothetical protein VFU21_32160, partial [Kofleriaceae bacterium]|nr:hypothetical protein [Kofleriaceae bacterium]